MQELIDYCQVETRDGSLCMYAKRGVLFADGGRPVLLMIHGAFRNSTVLFPWVALCDPEFDVVFADLPGHGRSPATKTVTIESFAANLADAVTAALRNREVVVVGESIGGLVGLAMGALHIEPIQGIVAADPPMTMSKLWHVRNAIDSAMTSEPSNQFLRSLAQNVFGVGPDGKTHERIYYDLIGRARVPVLVLTGDLPLFPVRAGNGVPCLIDEVDRYVLGRLGGDRVQFAVVAGCGHILLIEAKEKCRSIVGRFCDSIRSRSSDRPRHAS